MSSTYFKRHSARGATTKIYKPKIFWDEGRGKFIIAAPYAEAFKNEFQALCFSAINLGKSENYAWCIDQDDLDKAKTIVEAYFGEFDFIDKPSEDRRKAALNGHSSPAGDAALLMFSIGGYDMARKVYSLLIREYHPDKNPDPTANAKAAEITTAWKKLKEELGWS